MEETRGYTYSKDEARKAILSRRASIVDRESKCLSAARNMLPLLYGRVLVYIPIGSELSTLPLISMLEKKELELYAPHTVNGVITPRRLLRLSAADRNGNLPCDCYGERADDIDVCVTPLLGIDRHGYRLGYGKGCYDRYFVNNCVKKIGYCFDEQIIDFCHNDNDVPLDVCVTPSGVLYFSHESDRG